jgi:hypothetical protein
MRSIKAKKETCLKCGATDLENLVRIEEGEPLKVYVRCARCKTFVARYIVSTYTSDMSYESLLRVLRTSQLSCYDCRGSMRELEAFSRRVRQEFQRTAQQIEKTPEARLIVEMLKDEEADGFRPENPRPGRPDPAGDDAGR